MLDFFNEIGSVISNIFGFFQSVISSITGFIDSVKSWWAIFMTVLSVFPTPLLAIVGAAFTLLIVFIVIELLRDFL